ncbi:DNA alkylation repair protein [Virgibacillus litoralis]|uniref:3-methyladenine DNA glycosylase AlkD n=1 Tax=Virgibacillus litoralis TaxID=578221 RepID=A0ABS4H982_9BACI|nr:DNA alkylation repair protein [Virgibacillus litoralis]MBP1947468.1 3-methyladenine DNA glycosylase AlkD [Virgibacillus litoralis]
MDETKKTLESFVYQLGDENFRGAIETLKELGTGARNTPKSPVKNKAIEYVISTVQDKSRLRDMAIKLAEFEDATAKEIAAHLLTSVFDEYPRQVSNVLRLLANDENWEVREWVAGACGEILTNHFELFYEDIKSWTRDNSENVRRAASIAAMYAGKKRKEEYGEPLLDIVELLLTDSSTYVKKNLGQFAIGDGLLRYYPSKVLRRLNKWIEISDENARWNIAKIFSSAEGMKYICESESIIKILLHDERYKVKKAIDSTLNKAIKKNPDLVNGLTINVKQ